MGKAERKVTSQENIFYKQKKENFPRSPELKNPCFHCRFNPWSGKEGSTCHIKRERKNQYIVDRNDS